MARCYVGRLFLVVPHYSQGKRQRPNVSRLYVWTIFDSPDFFLFLEGEKCLSQAGCPLDVLTGLPHFFFLSEI